MGIQLFQILYIEFELYFIPKLCTYYKLGSVFLDNFINLFCICEELVYGMYLFQK